ncbi:RPM1 interacting protein 13 [Vigna angularis]|uniref:RPM1 interacting protein 13 n=1 Tax=Phaseolus angularis TaxID=3914 RepID=UPI00080A0886|nr:RPM1 interacting protein 13 [Vigna angularis]
MEEITVNGKSSGLLWIKEETPTRTLVCFRKEDMKRFEETEDCFILDFDPYDSFDFSVLSLDDKNNHQGDASKDVYIVGENSKVVACRDYPHPRHLCIKFPFTATPHDSYCELCYCRVCGIRAPCKHWTRSTSPHCDEVYHRDIFADLFEVL